VRRYIAMPGATELAQEFVVVPTFPDGETTITVPEIGIDDDIVLIGNCGNPQLSESFLAAAYEIASYGPHSLTVVNTYFRHARCERVFTDSEGRKQAVMAKFQARQWSGIGVIFPGVRLVFLDLHNDLVLSYFECAVRATNITALPLLERRLSSVWGDLVNPVYATVDYGGVHEARKLATARGCGFAHIDKKRISGTVTEIREVHGDVDGCDVVIFDDVVSTAGSAIKAAKAYKDRGARRVFVVAAHGVFVIDEAAGIDAVADMHNGDYIDGVMVTDSHPNAEAAYKRAPGFVHVYQLRPEQLAPAA
jgi:ribose-phosphate pyrophosphokinase